ncbi:MAG: aspartate 1-decarboxylase [Gammaproteobacteria bacterium]|jgi:aspartate 1-decarboxylase
MDCYRKLLGGKIHRATVTHADVDYEGSITIPPELMSAAGLVIHESVHVWDVTNGNRFETYTIEGGEGSGDISVNGAAAHLVSLGDIIIIAYFKSVHESELQGYEPTVVFVDERNRMKTLRHEIAGPQRRS